MPLWTSTFDWGASVALKAITVARLNQLIGNDGSNPGNLDYLRLRPKVVIKRNNSGSYSTTSSTYADIDATNLNISLAMSGTTVVIDFAAIQNGGGSTLTHVQVLVNGVARGGADGQCAVSAAGKSGIGFSIIVDSLTPGTNTFKLQWKSATAGQQSALLASGAADAFVEFSVAEIG